MTDTAANRRKNLQSLCTLYGYAFVAHSLRVERAALLQMPEDAEIPEALARHLEVELDVPPFCLDWDPDRLPQPPSVTDGHQVLAVLLDVVARYNPSLPAEKLGILCHMAFDRFFRKGKLEAHYLGQLVGLTLP